MKLLFKDKLAPGDEDPFWGRLSSFESSVKEPRNTAALCTKDAKIYIIVELLLRNHVPLFDKLGETIQQKHLERLISVQFIIDHFDANTPKEKIIYFLDNGRRYRLFVRTMEQDLTWVWIRWLFIASQKCYYCQMVRCDWEIYYPKVERDQN